MTFLDNKVRQSFSRVSTSYLRTTDTSFEMSWTFVCSLPHIPIVIDLTSEFLEFQTLLLLLWEMFPFFWNSLLYIYYPRKKIHSRKKDRHYRIDGMTAWGTLKSGERERERQSTQKQSVSFFRDRYQISIEDKNEENNNKIQGEGSSSWKEEICKRR